MASEGEAKSLADSGPSQRRFFFAQLALRVLATALTLSAIFVMVTSRQSFHYLSGINARYQYSSALKFFVGANAVASAFSLLSVFFVYAVGCPGSNPTNYFFILLHDMVVTVLVMSGCAAATAVGFLALHGQPQIFWYAICDYVNKFCTKLEISIALSFVAFLTFFALTIMSALKLKLSTQKKTGHQVQMN